ncbi:MAG: hypothetical protein AAB553_00005 [Patescibacteria group bacterium]
MINESFLGDPSRTSIMDTFLNNEHLPRLLENWPEKNMFIAEAQEKIELLGEFALVDLMRALLTGMGKNDQVWDADRRDGSLILLKLIPLRQVNARYIKNNYLRAVRQQAQDVSPNVLLDAGITLTPYLPDDGSTQADIQNAWQEALSKFGVTDISVVTTTKYEDLITYLSLSIGSKRTKRPSRDEIALRRQRIANLWESHSVANLTELLGVSPSVVIKDAGRLRESGVPLSYKEAGRPPNRVQGDMSARRQERRRQRE